MTSPNDIPYGFDTPSVPQAGADVLKQAMDSGERCIIIDVRTPEEYARARIRGSINIPVTEIRTRMERAVPNRDQTVYVYCLSGARSAVAVDEMMAMGYTDVFDIPYGLMGWRVRGYPVET